MASEGLEKGSGSGLITDTAQRVVCSCGGVVSTSARLVNVGGCVIRWVGGEKRCSAGDGGGECDHGRGWGEEVLCW